MANSNLISNLNSIYATKLEIKEVLNTESDDFTEYPDLIEAAIASGGATGTYNITENGTFDVATYASAYVAVPQQEVPVVPPGYSYVYGTKEILENGTVDISSYASAYVNVPAPEGWILPSGYAFVTTNGNFDIREFESVNVEVPASEVVAGTYNITENGTFDVTSYASAYVSVQGGAAVLGYQTILNNGITYASTYGLDGFSYVDVQVPTGHSGATVYDAMTIQEALDWVYANLNVGESSTDWFYIKGIIAEASSPITTQYGNWNAWLTDDGQMYYQTEDPTLTDLTKCLYVYRTKFYGYDVSTHSIWDPDTDMQIHVGDQVVIYCQLRWHTSSVPRIINGELIKQGTTAQNQLTITQSGTYDTTSYVSAYVNVSGGGGSDILSVSGVWMANSISDGVNTYQMMNSGGTLNGGLDSYSFGTYVTGNIISIYSNDCLTKWQQGNEIYYEDYDTNNYSSEIVATSGTFNWDATNQVANPSGGFYWSEQSFGPVTRRNYNFTDDLGTTYRISEGDYNTYSGTTANLIINWWEDPNGAGQRYAAIVGTDT